MEELCLRTGGWLLPREGIDLTAWACVACDQFTSQPEYWAKARAFVGNRPSALKLILPECDLGQADITIPLLHREMDDYLAQGVLTGAAPDGFILTERSTESGIRKGLMVLLDLEGYDYRPGSQSLIRPTEGTIVDRIPPRLQARRGAALELGHVMMLLDDPECSVVEPLYEKRTTLQKLYDFPLMMNGGRLAGYAVTDPDDIAAVAGALKRLKSGMTGAAPLLYAVGDGNHSLATAKAYWEERRGDLSPAEQVAHPARFAMAELVNLHDEALQFEPIHRVVFGAQSAAVLTGLKRYAAQRSMTPVGRAQELICLYGDREEALAIGGSPQMLAVGTLQAFLDEWLPAHPETWLDYVHGEAAVRALAGKENAVGFLLPRPSKTDLFRAIMAEGVLPRKTFSMGEAHEKRYYMEARKL